MGIQVANTLITAWHGEKNMFSWFK